MHFVIQRILTSIKISLAAIKTSTESIFVMCVENSALEIAENMESLLLQCNLAEEKWNNLQEFFPTDFQENNRNFEKTSIYQHQANNGSEKPSLRCLLCNICAQPVDESESSRIHFVGHSYHSKCANFFLNRVGTLLPQLISS